MTDIVITDELLIADAEEHDLANKVITNAAITASVDLGGSHYTIIVAETADATETVTGTRKVTATITESAGSSDTDDEFRALALSQLGAVSSTVIGIQETSEIVTSAADASETVTAGAITAILAETAAATETVTVNRAIALSETAAATATPTLQRTSTMVIAESAGSSDSDEAPAVADVDVTAASTETVTGITSRVPASESATAASTETVTPVGYKNVEISETAAASAAVTTVLTAITSIADEVDATSRVRSNVDTIGNFWVNRNGAAALWSGLPFTCILQDGENGPVYAAGEYGLYVMGADKDAGDPVRSRVTYDLMDFGSPQRKRWAGIYVQGSADGPYAVRVISSKGTFRYATQPTKEREAVQHRATPGRGLNSVKYRIDIQHTKPHATDVVIAELENIARRI